MTTPPNRTNCDIPRASLGTGLKAHKVNQSVFFAAAPKRALIYINQKEAANIWGCAVGTIQ
jgi:hypothetical protein